VIAIDNDRGILRYSIVSQVCFDLGFQKGVVRALSLGVVMVMPLKAHTVMLSRDGARDHRFALLGLNVTGERLGSRQYAGHGGYQYKSSVPCG